MPAPFKTIILILALSMVFAESVSSMNGPNARVKGSDRETKIGVLLTNHGSRSKTWRNSLLALEDSVRKTILGQGSVKGIKTAFMEYNEPSIATRLKEFDDEGFTDIILIPIFLTVSPHTFDDIPTIIGQKDDPTSVNMLKIEKIARYTPKARVMITPTIDFATMLEKNIVRRVKALSKKPDVEGLVMIAYGDETYERQWIDLLDTVANHVERETGVSVHSHGWCGHIAHYDPDRTTDAVNAVLAKRERALVIPVLIAHDEMFQVKIIGDGISKVANHRTRVAYKPDSILPDPLIQQWVVEMTDVHVKKVNARFTETR